MAQQSPARPPRIVAPDVARGLALLGIAWANVSTGWAIPPSDMPASTFGGVGPGGTLDQIAVVGSAMFAHVRGLPMFATLLGFGVGLITMSLWRRAVPPGEAQKVLLRRYGFLALFGAVHIVFLFFGDIMYLYGMLAMILIAMIRLRDRTLLITVGVLYGLYLAGSIVAAFLTPADLASTQGDFLQAPDSYLAYMGMNAIFLVGYVFTVPIGIVSLLPVMTVGFVAARKGVHQRPEQFLPVLKGWVAVTVAVIVVVGLPSGLAAIGVLPTAWAPVLAGINDSLGYVTGPGIAAAVLLACRGLQRRVEDAAAAGEDAPRWPVPLAMVVALGKRSMSGYLLQSMLFFVVCMPFTLDVGRDVGAFGQFLIALGVWATTLVAAWLLELAGKPGPFEFVHRRLSYGKTGQLPAPVQDQSR